MKVDEFNFDLRRTIILSQYINAWGIPKYRVKTYKNDKCNPIETYVFYGQKESKINHFATVGVSTQKSKNGKPSCHELMFVLSKTLGTTTEDSVINYLIDIAVYSIRDDVKFAIESLIPDSPLAPNEWGQKSILIDEPRGEIESLESFHVGAQHVYLYWLIPIYNNEYELILNSGIDSFDKYCDVSDFSLVDISRPSIIPSL